MPDLTSARAALADLTDAVGRVSDAYAERCDIARDADWAALKLAEETGELVAAYLKFTGRGRREGQSADDLRNALENEAADVLALLLLFCAEKGIDLTSALDRKWFRYLKD